MATRRRRPSNSPEARRRRRYTPTPVATRPPTGTYDPALDAEERASQRGLEDFRFDVDRARQRDEDDFNLARLLAGRSRDRALQDLDFQEQDLETQFGDSLADLLRGRTRAQEDRDRSLAALARQFQALGQQQTEQTRAAGVFRGGTSRLSAQRRAEAEAFEREPIETSFRRFMEDSQTSEQRLRRDRQTQLGRIGVARQRVGEDYDTEIGRLTLDFTRRGEDRATDLERAEREGEAFRQDVAEQRFFQARGSGWVPPTPPRNEITVNGVTSRRVHGGFVLPDGRFVTREQLRRLRQRGAQG